MADDRTKAIQRLEKEQKIIAKTPVEGVRFEPGGDSNPLEWTLFVEAPEEYVVGTDRRKCPYAGRVFPVKIKFPDNYPFKHPEDGAVCSADFASMFGPTKNVTDVAKHVLNILTQPNIDTAPEADIMKEMHASLPAYEEKARKMAEKAPKK